MADRAVAIGLAVKELYMDVRFCRLPSVGSWLLHGPAGLAPVGHQTLVQVEAYRADELGLPFKELHNGFEF